MIQIALKFLLTALLPTLAFADPASVSPRPTPPKYAEGVRTLPEDHAYLQRASATDYWRLAPYYLPQHNEKACSVASTVMALNSLRATDRLLASDELLTSESLLKLSPDFARIVGDAGHGIPGLEAYRDYLVAALKKFIPERAYEVEVLRFDGADARAALKRLRAALKANEENPKDVLIANFLQGILTGDPDGMVGHVAPIGAYDPKTDRVLVMDPDRHYYEPYWISTEKLLKAINTIDTGAKKARGLLLVRPAAGGLTGKT